jgi:hypothetical protein
MMDEGMKGFGRLGFGVGGIKKEEGLEKGRQGGEIRLWNIKLGLALQVAHGSSQFDVDREIDTPIFCHPPPLLLFPLLSLQ